MNCPNCDSLMYKSDCACGWKSPPVSTIQIKQMGAQETNFPLEIPDGVKNLLADTVGKERQRLCVDYMKQLLRGAI